MDILRKTSWLVVAALWLMAALPDLATAQVDPEADKLLKKVSKKVSALPQLTATYSYSLYDKAQSKNVSSLKGTIKLSGKKYRINLGDQILFCDGKTVWNYRPKQKEVEVTNYNEAESFSLQYFLNQYQSQPMKSRLDGKVVLDGQSLDKITLWPETQQEYYQIEIFSDVENILRQLVIHNRVGTTIYIKLADLDQKSKIYESEFIFNPANYSGVEVVDLR
jgi:outer membrane lipoprotein-sorting protein